jgi:(S)-ureidoglycine aminohydrolase
MQQLGYTRSASRPDHLLLTADTFVRAPLPGMRKATAIVHVSTAMGAHFVQYTAEFEEGGSLAPAAAQRFLYVLEGELRVAECALGPGHYAYMPAGCGASISASGKARASVIEKSYVPLDGFHAPAMLVGDESEIAGEPLGGDEGLVVRALLPNRPEFDFAVNTMTYAPGASLAMVEMHMMEHGLLMLAGGGIYRLGDRWYPVMAGDFIWMAPYCPQWFGALGKTPAKYLIYKDWNRLA